LLHASGELFLISGQLPVKPCHLGELRLQIRIACQAGKLVTFGRFGAVVRGADQRVWHRLASGYQFRETGAQNNRNRMIAETF